MRAPRLLGEATVSTAARTAAAARPATDPDPGAVSRLVARRRGRPEPAAAEGVAEAASRLRRRRRGINPLAPPTSVPAGDVTRLRARRRQHAPTEET